MIKTRHHPLSNECSASPVFTSSGLVCQYCGHVSLYLQRAQTPEKTQQKIITKCTVSNNIETSRLNSYICPHSFTPLHQRRKSHSDAVEVIVKKLPSLTSIRMRGTVTAANRKPRHNNTVTSRQYGRRAIFASGDVRFQDGDAVNLSKLRGWRCLSSSSPSFQCLHLR